MKKLFKINIVMVTMIAFLLMLAFMAPQAGATESWKQKIVRFAGTAGETVATGDLVCIKGSDGQVYKADANDADLRPAIGVIAKGGAAEATVEVVAIGILTGQTAASPGTKLYLSETAAAFTTTCPTNEQVVGWVMTDTIDTATSTTYFIFVTPGPSDGAAF